MYSHLARNSLSRRDKLQTHRDSRASASLKEWITPPSRGVFLWQMQVGNWMSFSSKRMKTIFENPKSVICLFELHAESHGGENPNNTSNTTNENASKTMFAKEPAYTVLSDIDSPCITTEIKALTYYQSFCQGKVTQWPSLWRVWLT